MWSTVTNHPEGATVSGGEAAPGTSWDRSDPIGRWFGAFDDAADGVLAPLRGKPAADGAAAVLSNLSDYGLVWVLMASWKARRAGSARRRAIAALAISGVASYAVNAGMKALVRRERPSGVHEDEARALPVRRPTSSSFPSGHTLAAFSTAVLLPDGGAQSALCLGFATAVAASRVHLRDHHASDVVGGAVIGGLLGLLGRPLVSRVARRIR